MELTDYQYRRKLVYLQDRLEKKKKEMAYLERRIKKLHKERYGLPD